jgi:uncharacterized protein (TIGR03067 family)
MILPDTDTPTPDAPSIRGTWQMIRAELAGEPAHALVVEHTTLEITGDRYFVRYDREVADRGRISFVSGDPHSTLTLRGTEGPNAGRSIPAIYQVRGDLLRICYGLDGEPPAAFTSPPGSPRYLATYRRKK